MTVALRCIAYPAITSDGVSGTKLLTFSVDVECEVECGCPLSEALGEASSAPSARQEHSPGTCKSEASDFTTGRSTTLETWFKGKMLSIPFTLTLSRSSASALKKHLKSTADILNSRFCKAGADFNMRNF